MASLEDWEARLESLEEALTSGVLIVKHGDTQVTYESKEAILKAISYVKRQIAKLNGTSRRVGYVEQSEKGL